MKKIIKILSILLLITSFLFVSLTTRRQPPVKQIPVEQTGLDPIQLTRASERLKGKPTIHDLIQRNPNIGQLQGLFRNQFIDLQDYSYILMPNYPYLRGQLESLEKGYVQTFNADRLRPLDEVQKTKARQIFTQKILSLEILEQKPLKQKILEQFGETPNKQSLHNLLARKQITPEEFNSIWNPDGRYTGFTIAQIENKTPLKGFLPEKAMLATHIFLPPPLKKVLIGPFFVPYKKNEVDVVLVMQNPSQTSKLFTKTGIQPTPNDFVAHLDRNHLIMKWPQIQRKDLYGNTDYGTSQCNLINNDPTDEIYALPLLKSSTSL